MSVQVKGSGTIGGLDEGLVVSGIVTSSTQINVGSNIKLGTAGVVTATSFSGSGANLTSLPAQATIANNADNRVITGGSGVNLNGEANLTYDGSTLAVTGAITGSSALTLTGELNLTGGSAATRYIDAFVGEAGTFALRGTNNADSSGHQVMMEMRRNAGVHLNYSGNTKLQTSSTGVSITGSIAATGEVNIPTWLVHAGDSDTKFGFEGPDTITFETAGSERLRIDSAGNLSLGKGSASSTSYGTNLQIHHSGTSGASIHLTDNNTGSSNGDGFHILTSSSHAYLWQRENANMVFGTQGIARWVMYGSDGTLAPNVDSTFDIGTSSIRVRNGYFDTLYLSLIHI